MKKVVAILALLVLAHSFDQTIYFSAKKHENPLIKHLVISPEVKHAMDNNLPLVALESTVITHG